MRERILRQTVTFLGHVGSRLSSPKEASNRKPKKEYRTINPGNENSFLAYRCFLEDCQRMASRKASKFCRWQSWKHQSCNLVTATRKRSWQTTCGGYIMNCQPAIHNWPIYSFHAGWRYRTVNSSIDSEEISNLELTVHPHTLSIAEPHIRPILAIESVNPWPMERCQASILLLYFFVFSLAWSTSILLRQILHARNGGRMRIQDSCG